MHDQLARVLASLDEASRRAHALADRLTPGEAADRPEPKRWSVAENLAHLNLTSEAFLPLIENALHEAAQIGGEVGRYRRDFFGGLLSMIVGPQITIRGRRLGSVRTKPPFEPTAARSIARIMADFDQLQVMLTSFVRSAEGLPIDQVRVESPFDKRVKYNLYSAFLIIARHQLRHIVHAEELWPVPGAAGGARHA